MINLLTSMTGEPILPSRTANQYLARYWFARFAPVKLVHRVKRFDAQLRQWINTGTVNVTVGGVNTTNVAYNLTPADNTFSNTCPIMVNYVPGASGMVPDTVTKNCSWSLYCTTSYYIVCWYQFSRKRFSTPSTQLPFILFSSNSRSSKIY
jgi:hypothetical protein